MSNQRTMRAKMKVLEVKRTEAGETLMMTPVCKTSAYPADGTDEDNTFARWSPSGELTLHVTNPDLFGKIQPGEKFYVDFTKAEA